MGLVDTVIKTALFTPSEAAIQLGISERTLRKLRDERGLRYVLVSARTIRYRADDLDDYLEAQATVKVPMQCQSRSAKKAHRTGTMISGSEVVGFKARQA